MPHGTIADTVSIMSHKSWTVIADINFPPTIQSFDDLENKGFVNIGEKKEKMLLLFPQYFYATKGKHSVLELHLVAKIEFPKLKWRQSRPTRKVFVYKIQVNPIHTTLKYGI